MDILLFGLPPCLRVRNSSMLLSGFRVECRGAIIHNSDHAFLETAKHAIELYFREKNEYFSEKPILSTFLRIESHA